MVEWRSCVDSNLTAMHNSGCLVTVLIDVLALAIRRWLYECLRRTTPRLCSCWRAASWSWWLPLPSFWTGGLSLCLQSIFAFNTIYQIDNICLPDNRYTGRTHSTRLDRCSKWSKIIQLDYNVFYFIYISEWWWLQWTWYTLFWYNRRKDLWFG